MPSCGRHAEENTVLGHSQTDLIGGAISPLDHGLHALEVDRSTLSEDRPGLLVEL